MNEWEEAIKEKMTGYKSTLPEGDRDEFLALLGGVGKVRPDRKTTLLWALPATIAAVLAVFLILPKKDVKEEALSGRNLPPAEVIEEDVDIIDSSGPDIANWQEEEEITAKTYLAAAAQPTVIVTTGSIDAANSDESEAQTEECIAPDNEENASREPAEEVSIAEISPVDPAAYKPTPADSGQKKLKIGPVAGIAAGSGLIAAVIPFVKGSARVAPPPDYDYLYEPDSGNSTQAAYNYHFPIRVGLSAGVSVAERLRVTTGLGYSLYRTDISNSVRNTSQYAHYLEIPLRLDWVFLSGKRFDVYSGTGLKGEYCIAAMQSGGAIRGDKPSLSLLASGGVQYNFTRRIGLYIEPELSYMFFGDRHGLQTYRSNNPLMFSVATGIRINLGNHTCPL